MASWRRSAPQGGIGAPTDLRRLGVGPQRKRSQRALIPGQLVQVDTLRERSLPRPCYQFTAIDPVTRLAHAQLHPSASSRNARVFLEDLLAALRFPVRSIQVDNGAEFRGAFEGACRDSGIALYTIPPRTPKANAKVERLQRTFRDKHYAFEPPTLTLD